MQNGTFQTVSTSPSFCFAHLSFSPNKSHQHLSLFMSLCHLQSVLSVHGIVWHRLLQQAQHKELSAERQFSSEELISFFTVIDTHHHFGCCIPALEREWPAPCEASSLTPDLEQHTAQDAASADASEAAAAQWKCELGWFNSCLLLERQCCRGERGGCNQNAWPGVVGKCSR